MPMFLDQSVHRIKHTGMYRHTVNIPTRVAVGNKYINEIRVVQWVYIYTGVMKYNGPHTYITKRLTKDCCPQSLKIAEFNPTQCQILVVLKVGLFGHIKDNLGMYYPRNSEVYSNLKTMSIEGGKIADDVGVSGLQSVRKVSQRSNINQTPLPIFGTSIIIRVFFFHKIVQGFPRKIF